MSLAIAFLLCILGGTIIGYMFAKWQQRPMTQKQYTKILRDDMRRARKEADERQKDKTSLSS